MGFSCYDLVYGRGTEGKEKVKKKKLFAFPLSIILRTLVNIDPSLFKSKLLGSKRLSYTTMTFFDFYSKSVKISERKVE